MKDQPLGTNSAQWWQQACVYQVYPRSFADANGDGIGDLKGITSRMWYLKALGIDAIWLCPFYPSPLNDGGYDVADYRDVDPRLGTLADFEELTAAARASGIRVIIDIVPNHCSSQHRWFQSALRAPKGSRERARFHFRDGKGSDKKEPPNDWRSMFGAPAWSPSGQDDGQFYLHMWDSTQPDFNWTNADVRADFIETLRFWAARGVAGFRVDVATGCAKDLSEPSLPWIECVKIRAKKTLPGNDHLVHPTWDRDEVFEIYKSWRRVLNEYDPPLCAIAEAFVSPTRRRLYADPEGLGQVFSFDILLANYNANEYRNIIDRQLRVASAAHSPTTWVLSNHDVPRHASRYGLPDVDGSNLFSFLDGYKRWLAGDGKGTPCDMERGLRRARAATLFVMALPGSMYIYQGEELGLPEVPDIPEDKLQDPFYLRNGRADKGRDGCRVPLPWKSEAPNFGFGQGDPAHLPQPSWFKDYAVDVQSESAGSTLTMYRQALALRRKLQSTAAMDWVELCANPEVLCFDRPGGWRVVMNMGQDEVDMPAGEILIGSGQYDNGKLPGETTVWLQRI